MLSVFETGARYQMYHALAMALAALVAARRAAIAFLAGILCFRGSLYLLALTGLPILGAITPLGGLCFIAGWGFWPGAPSRARFDRKRRSVRRFLPCQIGVG